MKIQSTPSPSRLDEKKKKLEQRQARLDRQKALLAEQQRKERNGELIALGLLIERFFVQKKEKELYNYLQTHYSEIFDANKSQDKRILQRLKKAFERLKIE